MRSSRASISVSSRETNSEATEAIPLISTPAVRACSIPVGNAWITSP
jgi:hypothetical protein